MLMLETARTDTGAGTNADTETSGVPSFLAHTKMLCRHSRVAGTDWTGRSGVALVLDFSQL